jgi:hypothetical protein
MHLPTTTSLINLLFFTTTISLQVVLASPLPFTDIERRWSAGETDVSPKNPIHPTYTYPNIPTDNPLKGLNPRHPQPPLRLSRLAARPNHPIHLTLFRLRLLLRVRGLRQWFFRRILRCCYVEGGYWKETQC